MAYDVTITRLPMRAVFEVKGNRDAIADWCSDALPPFPDRPNSLAERAARQLIHTGPDRWLLTAPLEEEKALTSALRPEDAPNKIAVTLISDTLTFFNVTGQDVSDVMAVATPLDLDPEGFPPDAATWTEAFGIKTLIRRIAGGWEIAVDRSYADWLSASLRKVAE